MFYVRKPQPGQQFIYKTTYSGIFFVEYTKPGLLVRENKLLINVKVSSEYLELLHDLLYLCGMHVIPQFLCHSPLATLSSTTHTVTQFVTDMMQN